MKKKLTKKAIDAAKYEDEDADGKSAPCAKGARCFVWDTEIPGYGLRIFPSGKKSFVYHYRFRGLRKLATIGRWGVLTESQARERALKCAVSVNDGGNPIEDRRAARRKGITMRVLCQSFLADHVRKKREKYPEGLKTADQYEARLERTVIRKWGSRPVEAIDRRDVTELHAEITKDAPYEANRFLQLASKLFAYAIKAGYLPDNTKNPATLIDKNPETPRDRQIADEEMTRLLGAIGGYPHVYIRAGLQLLILTGARKSEIFKATWANVDLDAGTLFLPQTKAGPARAVSLSSEARAILRSLPVEKDNAFVFPGHKTGTHLTAINKAWETIRDAAGLKDVRIHDLRHAFGSSLANNKVELLTISKALGHLNSKTTEKVYARVLPKTVVGPMAKHSRRVKALGLKVPANSGAGQKTVAEGA